MRHSFMPSLFGLLLGALVAAQDAKKDEAKKDEAKDDAKLLQGEWQAVALEREGDKAPEDAAKAMKLSFKDDTVTAKFPAKFKLDASKKPKTIDVVPSDGEHKDKTIEGIYDLKGDELKICIAIPSPVQTRPTEFATKAGSASILMVLKKSK